MVRKQVIKRRGVLACPAQGVLVMMKKTREMMKRMIQSIEHEESPVSSRISGNQGRQKVGEVEHERSIERGREDAADLSEYSGDDSAPFQVDKTEDTSSALSELDPRTLSGLDDCATK